MRIIPNSSIKWFSQLNEQATFVKIYLLLRKLFTVSLLKERSADFGCNVVSNDNHLSPVRPLSKTEIWLV